VTAGYGRGWVMGMVVSHEKHIFATSTGRITHAFMTTRILNIKT